MTATRARATLSTVYAVVIDRVGGDLAALAPRVAAALGVSAYDVRASLQCPGGGPAVIAVHAAAAEAAATAADLAALGLSVRSIDVAAERATLGTFAARGFTLDDQVLALEARDGERVELAYARIDAIVLASAISSVERSETVRERSFSPGRALLSGGLVNTRTRETTQRSTQSDSEELAFVFTGGATACRLGEKSLAYQGLGSALQPSRTANFQHLLTELRRRCPHARFDERLRKRAGQAQLLGRVLSPDDHLEFAVALVAASLRRA